MTVDIGRSGPLWMVLSLGRWTIKPVNSSPPYLWSPQKPLLVGSCPEFLPWFLWMIDYKLIWVMVCYHSSWNPKINGLLYIMVVDCCWTEGYKVAMTLPKHSCINNNYVHLHRPFKYLSQQTFIYRRERGSWPLSHPGKWTTVRDSWKRGSHYLHWFSNWWVTHTPLNRFTPMATLAHIIKLSRLQRTPHPRTQKWVYDLVGGAGRHWWRWKGDKRGRQECKQQHCTLNS